MTPTAPVSTRRFAAATLSAGLLAAVALPGGRLGLGMALVAALVIVAVIVSGAVERSRYSALLLALAVGLAAMAAVRATPWLLWIDIAAAIVLTALAAIGAPTWRAAVSGLLRWAAKLPPAPLFVARASGLKPGPQTTRNVLPIARGLALGSVLVLVFGALFASADAAFAEISDGVLSPNLDLGLLPGRVATFVAVVAICGATVLAARATSTDAAPLEAKGSAAWLIALVPARPAFRRLHRRPGQRPVRRQRPRARHRGP